MDSTRVDKRIAIAFTPTMTGCTAVAFALAFAVAFAVVVAVAFAVVVVGGGGGGGGCGAFASTSTSTTSIRRTSRGFRFHGSPCVHDTLVAEIIPITITTSLPKWSARKVLPIRTFVLI